MSGNTFVMHQTNYFGGGGGNGRGGGSSIEEQAELMRQKTRDGVTELLDLSKEIYETGKARAGEA